MKQLRLPYHIVKPPKAVRHARLDNIVLVPASLLPKKGKYQTIANNLPKGSVLICQAQKKQRIADILERVASSLRRTVILSRLFPTRCWCNDFISLH